MASNWMSANLKDLSPLPLKNVLLPGSHDSGMSKITGGTPFSTKAVCQTQTKSIGEQLELGIRVFDVRPVIGNGGQYVCGHYQKLDQLDQLKNQAVNAFNLAFKGVPTPTVNLYSWQGSNGQTIDEVVAQVNAFTDTNNELIVLNLSIGNWSCWNTDNGNNNFTDFTVKEWNDLFDKLKGIKCLFTMPTNKSGHLKELLMSDYLGTVAQPKAAVACIIMDRGTSYLDSNDQKGFFRSNQWYSDNETCSDLTVELDHLKIVEQVIYDYKKMLCEQMDNVVNALGDISINVPITVPGEFWWLPDLVTNAVKWIANPLKASWWAIRGSLLGNSPDIANILDEARNKRQSATQGLAGKMVANNQLNQYIVQADAVEDDSLMAACWAITKSTLPSKAKL